MQILCFRCEESVILGNLLVIKMHESWENTNAQRGVVNFTQLGKKVLYRRISRKYEGRC